MKKFRLCKGDTLYFTEYDRMFTIRRASGKVVVFPYMNQPELLPRAIKYNAFAFEII